MQKPDRTGAGTVATFEVPIARGTAMVRSRRTGATDIPRLDGVEWPANANEAEKSTAHQTKVHESGNRVIW